MAAPKPMPAERERSGSRGLVGFEIGPVNAELRKRVERRRRIELGGIRRRGRRRRCGSLRRTARGRERQGGGRAQQPRGPPR